jgi:hypothetical protein
MKLENKEIQIATEEQARETTNEQTMAGRS